MYCTGPRRYAYHTLKHDIYNGEETYGHSNKTLQAHIYACITSSKLFKHISLERHGSERFISKRYTVHIICIIRDAIKCWNENRTKSHFQGFWKIQSAKCGWVHYSLSNPRDPILTISLNHIENTFIIKETSMKANFRQKLNGQHG